MLAQWHLNLCARQADNFVCRGKIQLNLSSSVIFKPADEVCYIGIPLLGKLTPINDITVIVADSNAIISLNGVTTGRGVRLSVGHSAYLAIGSNSYIAEGSRICRISAQNSISIGKNCAISFGVTIIDETIDRFSSLP